MKETNERLLRIGTFSVLSQISVRMLRYYQDHGVLQPAVVDPFSGHRFYHADQLATAQLARLLRDAGFSVERIAQLVQTKVSAAQVEAALAAQREQLADQRDQLHAQLVALDQVSITLKGHAAMTEVTTTTLPAMTVAALRRVIPTYSEEGTLWAEIMPLLEQSGAAFPAGGISGATFHDGEYRENDVDVEVWMQIASSFTPVEPLQVREMPEQQIVTATMRGDYSQTPAVMSALGAYVAEHGLQTGAMFNIYRVSPAQNPDPSAWVTDICIPIVK